MMGWVDLTRAGECASFELFWEGQGDRRRSNSTIGRVRIFWGIEDGKREVPIG